MSRINENHIETLAIETLQQLGWSYLHGLSIAPGAEFSQRESFEQVILKGRLQAAIAKINPHIPAHVQDQAAQKVINIYSPVLLFNNETFHNYLVETVKIPYQLDGYERSHEVALFDFENPQNNEFLVVNQYTIHENNNNKRPDVLLFVNGIPLVVIELKNAASENATLSKAYEQLQTYKQAIPSLFTYNAVCIISDGHECKAGSVSAGLTRYMAWKTADGKKEASRFAPQIETMIRGMLNPATLLDLVRNFIVFEETKKTDPKTGLIQIEKEKKLAAYHQYYAVNKAVQSTIRATGYTSHSTSLSPLGEGWGEGKYNTGNTSLSPLGEGRGEGPHYRGGFQYSGLVTQARELRKDQTKAEEIFWQLVRNRQYDGLKFRRQHQIGLYITDFYCDDIKLVIEFDGGVHSDPEQAKIDKVRDENLRSLGFHIARFQNEELLNTPDQFFEKLTKKIGECAALPKPSPFGRGLGEGLSGDRRGGVVWHTQGSGKSLSMVFYAGKLITSPQMQNPTILVITDRNDLDDQLFDTFAASRQLLRQEPVQARDRLHLKELLRVASGGIVFTTIQKFSPDGALAVYDMLSDRSNIVVIADEAHRTQYGFEAVTRSIKDKDTKEVIGARIAYGFAKYLRDALPAATYIGFTGTPIEGTDVNTPQVFGNYVDIYDISQAVADGATVKIYYESRLAKVKITEEGRRLLEEHDAELEADEEVTDRQRAKAKWTKLEAIIGLPQRVQNLAADIVDHFEQRQKVFDGKAMIVAISRRVAVDLYNAIIALRPGWHDDDLAKGMIKVVMTATSDDGPVIAKHHTTKTQRKNLALRMKDQSDPLRLVIVRDMWLTGFDAPCLNTLYIDKPMRGHNLMQAIARVNRVFGDKPGGNVVDYLGIASDLKEALSFYSDAGGKGTPTETQAQAVALMLEKFEVVRQMFNEQSRTQEDILVEEPEAYYEGSLKFNYRRFFHVEPREKLSIILQAEEHILGLQDGKERFIREVTLLSQSFALSVPHEDAIKIQDDIAFFQAVKARLVKFEGTGGGRSDAQIESTIKQIIDSAVTSDGIIDIFDAAGIQKPELSILSEEFLMEVKDMKHKNLAFELLKKILNDEIKNRARTNIVQSRALLEMLEAAIKKYQNNLITTAEVIQHLLDLAKAVKDADKRGIDLNLTIDELAFYDALEVNDSAVKVLGDEQLRFIAREIAEKIRSNATIDWTIRESARAKLMVLVRRTLTRYGYPPDMQQKAIDTVLKQAELLADYWTE